MLFGYEPNCWTQRGIHEDEDAPLAGSAEAVTASSQQPSITAQSERARLQPAAEHDLARNGDDDSADTMRNTHHDTNLFEVPKLGTSVPCTIWKMNLFAKLSAQNLIGIVTGSEPLVNDWSDRKKACWQAGKKNAQLTILGAMTMEMQLEFQAACWTADITHLFDTIKRDYTRVREQNTVFVRADMYTRRLGRSERVRECIDDLVRRRNEIAGDSDRMSDEEMVSVLLSNIVEVYPGIVAQF